MDRDVIYFCLGFSVLAVFIFQPGLLIKPTTFKTIAVISVAEFVIGVWLHFTSHAHSSVGALLAPLPTVGYFRLCLNAFLNRVHREPVDVAYNWTPGLAKDRLFAFAFFFGGVFILVVATVGMEKLAQVGW